jgi:hypothetical protein
MYVVCLKNTNLLTKDFRYYYRKLLNYHIIKILMENHSGKPVFMIEDEINASPKTLLPYLSTASGLSKWFADKVAETENGEFVFTWDNQQFHAKKHLIKETNSIRFVSSTEKEDPAFIEFRTDVNELTGTTFLTIQDNSVIGGVEDYKELYSYCLKSLKERVGGTINPQ